MYDQELLRTQEKMYMHTLLDHFLQFLDHQHPISYNNPFFRSSRDSVISIRKEFEGLEKE